MKKIIYCCDDEKNYVIKSNYIPYNGQLIMINNINYIVQYKIFNYEKLVLVVKIIKQ